MFIANSFPLQLIVCNTNKLMFIIQDISYYQKVVHFNHGSCKQINLNFGEEISKIKQNKCKQKVNLNFGKEINRHCLKCGLKHFINKKWVDPMVLFPQGLDQN